MSTTDIIKRYDLLHLPVLELIVRLFVRSWDGWMPLRRRAFSAWCLLVVVVALTMVSEEFLTAIIVTSE